MSDRRDAKLYLARLQEKKRLERERKEAELRRDKSKLAKEQGFSTLWSGPNEERIASMRMRQRTGLNLTLSHSLQPACIYDNLNDIKILLVLTARIRLATYVYVYVCMYVYM